MQGTIDDPRPSPRSRTVTALVVGLAVGIAIGLAAGVALESSIVRTSGSPGVSAPLVVAAATGTVTTGPLTETASIAVGAGSTVCVFVGFVNVELGGGMVTSVSDSLGLSLEEIAATGLAENHSEELYVSAPVASSGALTVTIGFSGGMTPMGGSVAVIDVRGPSAPRMDGFSTNDGTTGPAVVSVPTGHAGDLLLLGVSGPAPDVPMVGVAGETALVMGNNTSGPFADGMGYGVFSANESGTSGLLNASLAASVEWNAIGVGLYAAPSVGVGTNTPGGVGPAPLALSGPAVGRRPI